MNTQVTVIDKNDGVIHSSQIASLTGNLLSFEYDDKTFKIDVHARPGMFECQERWDEYCNAKGIKVTVEDEIESAKRFFKRFDEIDKEILNIKPPQQSMSNSVKKKFTEIEETMSSLRKRDREHWDSVDEIKVNIKMLEERLKLELKTNNDKGLYYEST